MTQRRTQLPGDELQPGEAQTGLSLVLTTSCPRLSLWRNRDYMLLWSGQLLSNVGSQISQMAFPLLILAVTGSPALAGIVGALLTAPLQRRFRFGQLTIGSAWVWAISWLALAIAPNILVLGIANAVSFIIVPIYMSVQFSYRLIVIPDQLQGRVQSVYRLLSFGCQPVGLALAGLLIQWPGPIWTVIVLFFPQGLIALAATCYRPLRQAPALSELVKS
jgi:hypothetical protein